MRAQIVLELKMIILGWLAQIAKAIVFSEDRKIILKTCPINCNQSIWLAQIAVCDQKSFRAFFQV